MVTPDEAVALPIGTRVRITSKGQFTTFLEGQEGEVVYTEPLAKPEHGFACYVAVDDPRYGGRPRYYFISRDLTVLNSP